MIGALAIVAILAAALGTVVIRRIDQAALTQEVANLGSISNAIVLQAIRNQNLPSTNTWATIAAAWAGLPVSAITTTPRNYSRAFLIDGSGWLGTNALPYTQTNTGTTIPVSARVMIVSTISKALPVSTGTPTAASFNDIWNTPDGTKPGTWSTWTGSGRDIVIQRINLQPLFHRVILFNRESNTNVQCYATVNGGSQLPLTNQWDAYYLHGSVLGLGTNSNLLLTEVVNSDMSRSYESGSWSDQIGAGPPATLGTTNLDAIAYAFVNSPFPPITKKGDNTVGVADSLLAYMNAYGSWANMDPCFSYGGNGTVNKVVEYQIMQAVATCFGGSAQGTCTIVP
jgi:hypothetical protein